MYERTARWVRVLWYLVWAFQIALITNVWFNNRWPVVQAGGPDALIGVAALCGLIGAFCLLTQLFLISGIFPVEKAFGLDKLARMHHVNGFVGYTLVMTHITLMVSGYSALTGNGLVAQYFELRHSLPYITAASFAAIALNIVAISSVVIIRRRLRYEWWRAIHWLVYSVILLSFWHQIANGAELLGSRRFSAYWITLYFIALGSVTFMRWLRPILLYIKFGWRVERVEKENDTVTSIYVTGSGLDRFQYWAGQFNFWYFWQPGFRLQKHPFTISSSPGDPYLRLSAKAIGDYSTLLADIKPGTPVLINGPFGRFSMVKSSGAERLFIAGGIGITPFRSILGDGVVEGDVLLYSVHTKQDLIFKPDFDKYQKRGLKVRYILRDDKPRGKNMISGQLDTFMISSLVPDVEQRDVWLCGPPAMMDAVKSQLLAAGVPRHRIHTEIFRL